MGGAEVDVRSDREVWKKKRKTKKENNESVDQWADEDVDFG